MVLNPSCARTHTPAHVRRSYYNKAFGVEVAGLAAFTVTPYLAQAAVGVAVGSLADKLIREGWQVRVTTSMTSWCAVTHLPTHWLSLCRVWRNRRREPQPTCLHLCPLTLLPPPSPPARAPAAQVRTVRRVLQAAGTALPALLLLMASWVGAGGASALTTSFTLVTVGAALSALTLASVSVNHLDICPRYAGFVFGAGNTLATLAGAGRRVRGGAGDLRTPTW
jgi:hypothetical protein